jgi:hypothetical protein
MVKRGRISHEGSTLYLHASWGRKFLGKLAVTKDGEIFITHVKDPERHFYIKGQGYPINYELLTILHNRGIKKILIPEDGKTGFRVYLATVDDYLKGEGLHEDEDAQHFVPLKELPPVDVPKDKIFAYLRH